MANDTRVAVGGLTFDRAQLGKLGDSLGPVIGLILVIAFFALQPGVRERFLTPRNFQVIATQTVIVGVAALGMTAIIISAGIDLSVGSVVALTSVVGALSLGSGVPPTLAIVITIGTGVFVGLLNGALVTYLKLAPFIVTLGMMSIARGLAKWLAKEQTVNTPDTWLFLIMRPLPNIAPGVWIWLALIIAVMIVLRQTVFGRYIFAIGSNEATARLCGVRVDRFKPLIYAFGGFFFGVSGLFQLARLHVGDSTSAAGLELDVIAAVVIGGASLNGGIGNVLGSITGALIMAVLRNGLQQMSLPTFVQEIMIGIIIIVAVALDRLRHGKET
jgi:ribose transport system permease protein